MTDVYVIKLDKELDTVWTQTYGGANNDWPNQVFAVEDGSYIVIGTTQSYGTGGDVYFLKIAEDLPSAIDVPG